MATIATEGPDGVGDSHADLARRLGPGGVTLVVVGGIVGAGIFINPYLVAQRVHTPALFLAAWATGGGIALVGAFIYAELAARLPVVGGQYAYLREAYHPAVAFLYGWVLLLVVQTGGMAAVAVTFAKYFLEVTRWPLSDAAVAAMALALLTAINCLGVRAGSRVQGAMTGTAVAAILALEAASLLWGGPSHAAFHPLLDRPISAGLGASFAAALGPVLFAYGGWHTASFLAGEMKRPERTLPRGILLGVAVVVTLYLSVNLIYVRALGPAGLADTETPASAVARAALGDGGATAIAAGIAVAAFGFLGQSILTAPRVYFAMARDGLFFRSVARVDPRTHAPIAAIALQGAWAIVIAISGRYEEVVSYVVSSDLTFIALTATALFVLRRRARAAEARPPAFVVPGHPWTTLLFIAAEVIVVASTFYVDPAHSLAGWGIALAGLPAYAFWRRSRAGSETTR